MLLLLLFSAIFTLLPDVWATDHILDRDSDVSISSGVYARDGFKDADDITRNIVQEEIDKILLKRVAGLQKQLASQDRRIKYLENREQRRGKFVEKLALKVLNLERNCDCPRIWSFVKNQKELKKLKTFQENVQRDQENVQRDQENVQRDQERYQENVQRDPEERTDADYHKDNSDRHIIKHDVTMARNGKEGAASSFGFRRQTVPLATHVAFTAYLDRDVYNMGVGHTIKMNQVLLNDGNGYNLHTGIFTAPVSGVYMFNYHISGYIQPTLVRLAMDSIHEVDAVLNPYNSKESMSGNTAVLKVAAGQSVWLEEAYFSDGDLNSNPIGRYCTFSGVLLY